MAKEPSPRWDHYSAPVDTRLYVWGGRTKKFTKDKSTLTSSLHVFDPFTESWEVKSTTGPSPQGVYNGASASSGLHLYQYGGYDGTAYHDSFFHLDTKTLQWAKLPSNDAMKNSGCRMVASGDRLFLFGGFGYPSASAPSQEGANFVKFYESTNAAGWTNELHMYDCKEGKWSSPDLKGTRPPPCSVFSLTMVDDHRAVLFGGRQSGGRTNDVYIINLNTMHCSKLQPRLDEPRPMARSSHGAVCLGWGNDAQLLVVGGLDKDGNTLSDLWVLDMKSGRWREIDSTGLRPRCVHSATSFRLSPGLTEVVLFGGCPQWPKNFKTDADVSLIANATTVLRFEYQLNLSTGDEEWTLINVADSQLGSPQRLREKMLKLGQGTNTSSATPLANVSTEEVAGIVKAAGERAREAETRAQAAEIRAQAAETRVEEAYRAKLTAETSLREVERRAQVAESKARETEGAILAAKTMHKQEMEKAGARFRDVERQAETRLQEERRRLGRTEESLRNCEDQLNKLQSSWVVEKGEIQLTKTELGRGAWATVSVAVFRGTHVAAKVIHDQIISPYNIGLFKREMDMAARIRHPNLLQFIGATNKGEMIILTELMDTSLRRELERVPCKLSSPAQAASLGLDVARALNYLHHMRPHPLIHRDISSANVLLEPLHDNRWKAKVSDYGTVNLSESLTTKNPGNFCYAAPEASDPNQQSPKMDIYSFGVLLAEILTGEFPDQLSSLLCKIDQQDLLNLIEQCLKKSAPNRPSAANIISSLEH